MIESRLITRKNQIETELKRGVRDPKRKQYLLENLLLLERDIGIIGFDQEEIKKNNFIEYRSRKTANETTKIS